MFAVTEMDMVGLHQQNMSNGAEFVDFDSETQFRKSTELWESLVLFAFEALFIHCDFKNTRNFH
jgi:hypothetical protein